ncbi:MAG: hypothetical protein WA364_10495 [Candidatus Nitrosopolaris sp.]
MVSRRITKILGVAMIVAGLSAFCVSYIEGSIAQYKFSDQGCAVNFTPKICAETNVVIVTGFIGMILSFFTALFGAYLIIPSALTTLVKRIRGVKQV